MQIDVAVVGAGAAGLACARALADAGRSVVVLEARDRLGGRIRSLAGPDGSVVELGAQVVHGDRAACWSVLGEPGDHHRYGEGATLTARLGGSLIPAWKLVRSGACLLWGADGVIAQAAGGEDDVAVSDVLRAARRAPAVDEEWVRQNWAGEPAELSAQGVAAVLGASDAGSGEFVVTGGFAELPRRLADGLDVRLSTPVERIDRDNSNGGVVLRTAAGDVPARACVVTVPPPVLAGGGCEVPWLPDAVRDALARTPLGDAVSVAVQLTNPAPESALLFDADGEGGFWRVERGSRTALGVAKGATAQQLREIIGTDGGVDALAQRLLPWAGEVSVLGSADWGLDPWSRGAFSYPAVGRLDLPALLARRVEDVLFLAGEATCGARHPASVHGAMESGRRAASDVLAAITMEARA